MLLLPILPMISGCFQDYTVDERMALIGKLVNKSEQQLVAFSPFDSSTFSSMDARVAELNSPKPKIVLSSFLKLPKALQVGEHFEMWGVNSTNLYSFGKFVEQNGSLFSYIEGNPAVNLCTTTGGQISCTFEYQGAAGTSPTNFDRLEVSLEPARDPNPNGRDGAVILAGDQVTGNATDASYEKMGFPIKFEQNGIFPAASIQMFFEDAKKGQVILKQFGFPDLDPAAFFYELRAFDEDISASASCGSFNVKDGKIVSVVTGLPRESDVFLCGGIDLTQFRSMIISLEPKYEGNSKGSFDFIPLRVNYAPFTSSGIEDFSIYNLRASVAGKPTDQDLTDVVGNYTVLTTRVGHSYLVFRGINHEPSFQQINVIRGKNITGLSNLMNPKIKGTAIFHAFSQDFADPITSAFVVGNIPGNEIVMNDSGIDGDLVKSDGIWTAKISNLTQTSIDYEFRINGKLYDDAHAETRAAYRADGSRINKSRIQVRQ